MKILAEKFNRNGFAFEQVKRSPNAAIYRKRKSHWPEGSYSWETIKVRTREEQEAFGRVFEAGEFYPSSTEWGVYGFTYGDLAGAEARFLTIAALAPPKSKKGTTTE